MSKPKLDYKTLRDKWYAKLKRLGFDDAEDENGSLKSWHSKRFMVNNDTVNARSGHAAKAEYYYKAAHFLNEHKFQKEIHKAIWEAHSDGLSITDITKKLRRHRRIDRNAIYKIVKYYRELMLNE